MTVELVSGPETLSDEELAPNIADFGEDSFPRPFDDDRWRARTPDYAKITVPLLSAANWGGISAGRFSTWPIAPGPSS